MLTDGLYRDKDGQTVYVRRTVTGYLICYSDGRIITLPIPPIPAAHTPAPDVISVAPGLTDARTSPIAKTVPERQHAGKGHQC